MTEIIPFETALSLCVSSLSQVVAKGIPVSDVRIHIREMLHLYDTCGFSMKAILPNGATVSTTLLYVSPHDPHPWFKKLQKRYLE